MPEMPERPAKHEQALWADLSHDDFQELVTPPQGLATGKVRMRPVDVPGFQPGEIKCSWESTVAKRVLDVRSVRVDLERNGESVATFDFALRRVEGSYARWFLWYRFVEPEVEGTAIATYGLRTAEQFIARICAARRSIPRRLTTDTTRPRLVSFLLKNDYEFDLKQDRIVFERFMSERAVALAGKHDSTSAYVAYVNRGELPSFWEVRLFLGRQEQGKVLFSRNNLGEGLQRRFEEVPNKHFILRIKDLKELRQMPGTVRMRLHKNLGRT